MRREFATAIREAEILGVLARGALSALGIHLRTGDMEGLGIECRRLLPSATATARIGADVTGTPSARLAALLDALADRETSGTASVCGSTPAASAGLWTPAILLPTSPPTRPLSPQGPCHSRCRT
nr:hypothetical protein [Streptomyces sp. GC420]